MKEKVGKLIISLLFSLPSLPPSLPFLLSLFPSLPLSFLTVLPLVYSWSFSLAVALVAKQIMEIQEGNSLLASEEPVDREFILNLYCGFFLLLDPGPALVTKAQDFLVKV